MKYLSIILIAPIILVVGCKKQTTTPNIDIKSPDGMIWVEGKEFLKGAKKSDDYAMPREKPAHKV